MPVPQASQRVVIEDVSPEIDAGRYAAKRVIGDNVTIEADIFCDGPDALTAALLYRHADDSKWQTAPMRFLQNDRWHAQFTAARLGQYEYTLIAWVDHFKTWQRDIEKKFEAEQDIAVDLQSGALLLRAAAERAKGADAAALRKCVDMLLGAGEPADKVAMVLSERTTNLVQRHPDRSQATEYPKKLTVQIDPLRARFSAWYELFPRSTAEQAGKHGTFKDCERWLPYIAEMGFDVLYLPPIHPTGRTHRKGPNNNPSAHPGDLGSPWAIGGPEGGHKAVHPDLGTLGDFRHLVQAAGERGIAVALDIAFQCSPDHPYVTEHPEWFTWRPDNTVQYAENPPKKYQDIYPFNFETAAWQSLWEELLSVFTFWIEQGVRIFRVDNPHTKPFHFWEWVIGQIKGQHPDIIFLAEAFTRPKVMYNLGKLGYTQSYTYFAWRNTKDELTAYFTELTQSSVRDYFRPNLWPNTPDILTERLQHGGRPAFIQRLVLAATLGASYGIYGPAYELCEREPYERGSEEYLNSEKYQIRHRDLNHPDSLREYIALLNTIRKTNPALQQDWNLHFLTTDNDQIIAYAKYTADLSNVIITVINLDLNYSQSGWITLPLADFGLDSRQPYEVHDLLTDARYLWNGPANYVQINRHESPAHVFRLRRPPGREQDTEYSL